MERRHLERLETSFRYSRPASWENHQGRDSLGLPTRHPHVGSASERADLSRCKAPRKGRSKFMSSFTSVIAPSPLKDEMGNFLHDGGCTFRVWALFATGISVKIFPPAGAPLMVPMANDTAAGYGTDVWSVFVPGVAADVNYRFLINFAGGSVERVDPF